MARRKRKQNASVAGVAAGLPVIRRQDDVLEPVYEAIPTADPSSTTEPSIPSASCCAPARSPREMHDAARDFQAQFTIARYDIARLHAASLAAPGGGRAAISPRRRSTRGVVWARPWTLWAGSAARPAAACGTSSGCSARSASGRCGRQGWGCWWGIMGTAKRDCLIGRERFPPNALSQNPTLTAFGAATGSWDKAGIQVDRQLPIEHVEPAPPKPLPAHRALRFSLVVPNAIEIVTLGRSRRLRWRRERLMSRTRRLSILSQAAVTLSFWCRALASMLAISDNFHPVLQPEGFPPSR